MRSPRNYSPIRSARSNGMTHLPHWRDSRRTRDLANRNTATAVHLLIAGPTGSGKSSATLSLIATLCADREARFALIDTKGTGFSNFEVARVCLLRGTDHAWGAGTFQEVHAEMLDGFNCGIPPRREPP